MHILISPFSILLITTPLNFLCISSREIFWPQTLVSLVSILTGRDWQTRWRTARTWTPLLTSATCFLPPAHLQSWAASLQADWCQTTPWTACENHVFRRSGNGHHLGTTSTKSSQNCFQFEYPLPSLHDCTTGTALFFWVFVLNEPLELGKLDHQTGRQRPAPKLAHFITPNLLDIHCFLVLCRLVYKIEFFQFGWEIYIYCKKYFPALILSPK